MISIPEREKEAILQTYGRLPIVIDRAEACYIFDNQGNKYLDLLGGIAVNLLGHSHPRILDAISKQSQKYLHVSNFFFQEPQVELAERLKKISALDKVFYCNSGAETTEGALKIARKWGNMNNKKDIIAFSGGFHGRTYGALSIMDKPKYKDKMGPFLENIKILEYNNISDLENRIDNNTGSVFLEIIQGEGGLTVSSQDWINKLIELQEKYNFLIVADEVQSGLGRSGKYFAYEHFNLKPNIVTVAKGLGGGIPIGAIITDSKTSDVLDKGQHGTTFGGNALACATGIVVLDEIENGLLEHVNNISEYLKTSFELLTEKFPDKIVGYKGIGLMCGIELKFPAKNVVDQLLDKFIIANATSETILRLVPPYIVGRREIDHFIDTLEKIISEININ